MCLKFTASYDIYFLQLYKLCYYYVLLFIFYVLYSFVYLMQINHFINGPLCMTDTVWGLFLLPPQAKEKHTHPSPQTQTHRSCSQKWSSVYAAQTRSGAWPCGCSEWKIWFSRQTVDLTRRLWWWWWREASAAVLSLNNKEIYTRHYQFEVNI